jgi:hypothetical protein
MSELRAATVSNLAGTGPVTLTGQFAAKAWVNFNGTGTIAARDSFNVASLTDNGTGDYSVNFSSAMADANYSAIANADGVNVAVLAETSTSIARGNTASLARVGVVSGASSFVDVGQICLLTHGDLA